MSANSMREIGYKQGAEFFGALEKAGFTGELVQQVINSKGNKLAKAMFAALGTTAEDSRFGPAITEFNLTVPADYNHEMQIDSFAKQVKELQTTYYYNEDLNSANFARATNELVPGKTYKVKIFPILATVTSEDCISFLRKQNAILMGRQGLTLAQSLKSDQFPFAKWVTSFDEKDALWEDASGNHRVPLVNRNSGGGWRFDLGHFEYGWPDDHCLLCFRD